MRVIRPRSQASRGGGRPGRPPAAQDGRRQPGGAQQWPRGLPSSGPDPPKTFPTRLRILVHLQPLRRVLLIKKEGGGGGRGAGGQSAVTRASPLPSRPSCSSPTPAAPPLAATPPLAPPHLLVLQGGRHARQSHQQCAAWTLPKSIGAQVRATSAAHPQHAIARTFCVV